MLVYQEIGWNTSSSSPECSSTGAGKVLPHSSPGMMLSALTVAQATMAVVEVVLILVVAGKAHHHQLHRRHQLVVKACSPAVQQPPAAHRKVLMQLLYRLRPRRHHPPLHLPQTPALNPCQALGTALAPALRLQMQQKSNCPSASNQLILFATAWLCMATVSTLPLHRIALAISSLCSSALLYSTSLTHLPPPPTLNALLHQSSPPPPHTHTFLARVHQDDDSVKPSTHV